MSESNRTLRDAHNQMPVSRSGVSSRLREMGIRILSNTTELPNPDDVHDCDRGFAVRLQSGRLWCTACGYVEEK